MEEANTTSVRVLPLLLTREGWYLQMHARSGVSAPLLTSIERHVSMLAAARYAERNEAPPPFKLRPGLVPAIVGFYDQLMRHRRSVDAFERLMTADLEPSLELDRGARRLLRQTTFLASTFRRYETKIAAVGRVDEHGLRGLLTTDGVEAPFTRVILTVPDHVVDPTGLWPADYDLLTRQPALERIDVVVTDRVLDSGFYERITDLLPDIEEERIEAADAPSPVVVTPADSEHSHFVWRDREEELLAVIRSVKSTRLRPRAKDDPDVSDAVPLARRVGVVFRRRLPYLYLARQLFGQAGVPFETLDALPLAAEPYAAALDLVCSVVTSQYDRPSIIALLRSPHFAFAEGGQQLDVGSVQSLDQSLRDVRFAGGRAALVRLVRQWTESGSEAGIGSNAAAAAAASVAAHLAEELSPLEDVGPPSTLLETLAAFLERHATERTPPAPPHRTGEAGSHSPPRRGGRPWESAPGARRYRDLVRGSCLDAAALDREPDF